MPDITINGMTGGACNHRVVNTSAGDFTIHLSQITDADPRGLEELLDAAIIILKHQYLTLRAGPPTKTHAQALAAMVGFVVRI